MRVTDASVMVTGQECIMGEWHATVMVTGQEWIMGEWLLPQLWSRVDHGRVTCYSYGHWSRVDHVRVTDDTVVVTGQAWIM